ncbi:MAG: hypothetical protein ACI8XI_000328 [Woeseiaceae bacterium]|jgi:hypothetical protein|tara:strand:- start:54329 stop:55306 length:978 start_codon:yes stop_codon:yes gene_type:complete
MFGLMMPSVKNPFSIIVLPALGDCFDIDLNLQNWLARSNLTYNKPSQNIINRILYYLDVPEEIYSFGALRYYGETKKKPMNWIASADPVFIQAHLDRMLVKPISQNLIDKNNMVFVYNEINKILAKEYSVDLMTNGITGYIQSKHSIPTSSYSPTEILNLSINQVFPSGGQSKIYGQLINEIQMLIYDSKSIDSNLFNSLWLWGGGYLDSFVTKKLPVLYSNNHILKGYWYASESETKPFHSDLENLLNLDRDCFIAVTADDNDPHISSEKHLRSFLSSIHQYQNKYKPERLILIFRDGWTADISAYHKYRIWRKPDFVKKIGHY